MEVVPPTLQIASYTREDVNEFCEIIYDYSIRLSQIEDDYNKLCSKLEQCFEFINSVNVPFAFEYVKVSYTQTFQYFVTELDKIKVAMITFPETVEVECLIALANNTYEQKKKCIYHLDMLLSCINVSLTLLDADVDKCIKRGLSAHNASKIVCSRCR